MDNERIMRVCGDACGRMATLAGDLGWEPKGILASEMLLLCAVSEALGVERVLESGRARGNSTEVIARWFHGTAGFVLDSVEYQRGGADAAVAHRRLQPYRNARLRYGNAVTILPWLVSRSGLPATVLIDGPKGRYAIQLASRLLTYPRVLAVFIHDLYAGTPERAAVEEFFSDSFSTDAEPYVSRFRNLDDACWAAYAKWPGHEDWGPYRRGTCTMASYGPTLTMIPNLGYGMDRERIVTEHFSLAPLRRRISRRHVVQDWLRCWLESKLRRTPGESC